MQTLPAVVKRLIPNAQLPANYLAARMALSQCDRVDEVKDIHDKFLALAVYAKEAKDDSLASLSKRIQLRAVRRMGELLESLPHGAARDAAKKQVGTKAYQAVGLAQLPEAAFERHVEATPVLSPIAILRREGMYGTSERMQRTPEGVLVDAVLNIARVIPTFDAKKFGRSVASGQMYLSAQQLTTVATWLSKAAQGR